MLSYLFLLLFFVVIILLITIMFILLNRLIAKINQQAIDYFVDKLKAYDDLIDKKEFKLKDLNEMIDNKVVELDKKEDVTPVSNKQVYLYDLKPISYVDKDIFKRMKNIEKKFSFDNRKLVEDFINNKFDEKTVIEHDKYSKVREKFTQDVIFNLYTMRERIQIDKVKEILGDSVVVLDDFMKKHKKFDLKKFISYFDKIIEGLDPCVYVYVGSSNENYNGLNNYVKTVVDDSIFKGLKIMYKGKLYDYSL